MIPERDVAAAVDDLKRDGIEVTVRVEALQAPGTTRADDALFAHVVRSTESPAHTWWAVFRRLRKLCATVSINLSER